jgi:SAM-dependent methyltransferase
MTSRHRTVLPTIAAIVLYSVLTAAAQAEPVAGASIEDEASRQAGIYASRGANVPEGYVLDRSLLSYTIILPSEFKHTVARLGAQDRWLDIGAGEGRAILDYGTGKYDVVFEGLQPGGARAQAVAISIEDRRTLRWHQTVESLAPGRIEYLFGKRLREYSVADLGRFQLITDVMGGFSYSRDLALLMERTLAFLAPNGMFFTVLQDVRSEAGTNRPHYAGARFLTELTAPDGSELKVCSWLKSIGCVEVTCEARPQTAPPIEVYGIRKVCERVSVPALELVHFEAGTPPERRFRAVTRVVQP